MIVLSMFLPVDKAMAITVFIDDNTNSLPQFNYPAGDLADFYNSLDNVQASISFSSLEDLSGFDFYVAGPKEPYSAQDINALMSFLNTGGRALLVGDYGEYGIPIDGLNATLSSLGSSMLLDGVLKDGGGHHNTVEEQIIDDFFTNEVDIIRYAAVNTISGGIPLLLTSDLSGSFFSYELYGSGYLFVSADYNIFDNINSPEYDNSKLLTNLFEEPTAVPIPSSMILLGAGLTAISILRRKLRKF